MSRADDRCSNVASIEPSSPLRPSATASHPGDAPTRHLRLLLVEDSVEDAELLVRELRRAGFELEWRRVDTEPDYLAALDSNLDLVISDHTLPGFDGLRSLYLLRERGLEIPFILVSGMIGEEAAASAMREGASDYLLKDRLGRLGAAVDRALEQRGLVAERRRAESMLRESAQLHRILAELTSDYTYVMRVVPGEAPRREWVTDSFLHMVGYPDGEPPSSEDLQALVVAEDRGILAAHDDRAVSGLSSVAEFRIRTRAGETRWLRDRVQPAWDPVSRSVCRIYGASQDITETRRNQEMVAASERHFRSLIESSSDLIAIVDCNRKVRYASPSIQRILGYEAGDLVGTDAFDLVHPGDRSSVERAFKEALTEPGSMSIRQFRARHSDGTWRLCEGVATATLDDPLLSGVVVNLRDITVRAELEEAHRNLVDHSLQGLAIVQDSAVVFANSALATMSGYSQQELVSDQQPARMLSLAGDGVVPVGTVLDLLDVSGAGQSTELRLVARSGALRYVEALAKRTDFRARPALQVVFLDVTERKRLEIAGREDADVASILTRVWHELIAVMDTPELLQRLCQVTTDVLECDSSHTYVWREDRRTFEPIASHGEGPGEVELRRAFDVPGRAISALLERLEHDTVAALAIDEMPRPLTLRAVGAETGGVAACLALRCGESLVGFQLVIDRRRAQLSPLQSRIAHGTSQVASMALENARLLQKLGLANDIKSEFVSTMSHEFRTPLNAIMGYTSLLLEGVFGILTEEQSEMLEHVATNSKELLSLVEGILDLGRLEKHRLDLEASEIAIEELMADVDRETRGLQSKPGLEFVWRVEPDVPRLRSDVAKIKIALRSLIDNAAKFTPSGIVEVHAGSRDHGIEFYVADTGIGIADEVLPIIFEPFRQGDGSMSRPYGGVGLGLYLVSRVMEVLGGRVAVETAPGCGSRFTLWVPNGGASAVPA